MLQSLGVHGDDVMTSFPPAVLVKAVDHQDVVVQVDAAVSPQDQQSQHVSLPSIFTQSSWPAGLGPHLRPGVDVFGSILHTNSREESNNTYKDNLKKKRDMSSPQNDNHNNC